MSTILMHVMNICRDTAGHIMPPIRHDLQTLNPYYRGLNHSNRVLGPIILYL